MEMISEKRINASREQVWAALNDTEVLKKSMPGCESFDAVGENTFEAKITAKVGPVKARFKFNVSLTNIDPPNGYTINGEGQGGAAGFARGSATVNLAEADSGTLLSYNVKANVGGKLAQLGARLIDGAAKKMADEFFGNFIEIVTGDSETADNAEEDVSTDKSASQKASGIPPWAWVTAVIIIAAIIFSAFS
jgi:carbon monoxide dehydrogenase subunit G